MPTDPKLAREHAQMLALIKRIAASVTYTASRQEARELLTEMGLGDPAVISWRVVTSSRVTNPPTLGVVFVKAVSAALAQEYVERNDPTLTVTKVVPDRRDPL